MSDFMWTAITSVAFVVLCLLGVVLFLFILLMLFIAPALWPQVKQRLQVRWSRLITPYTLWKVKRAPSLEVSEAAWDRIFHFQQKTVTVGNKTAPVGHVGTVKLSKVNKKFSYSFMAFESGMKPEVREWCAANLEAQPTIQPPYVTSSISRVRMFLVFTNENDAFAFKMRWC